MEHEGSVAVVEQEPEQTMFDVAEKIKSGEQVTLPLSASSTDEKKEAASSAADEGTDKKEAVKHDKTETDPVKLQAQVEGLKKELARTRPKADDMAGMREKVAELEGRIKQATETKVADSATKEPVYTDAQLETFQDEWEKVLRQARDGDGTAVLDDGRTVTSAQVRHQLDLIDTEKSSRRVQRAAEAVQIKAESDAVLTEAASLIEEGRTLFPDLQNKDSDLFKAANAEYMKRARFMKALGPYADLVAVSLAVSKNPALIGKVDTKARTTLLKEIEKTADSALTKGGGAADIKTTPNFGFMKAAAILACAEKIKSGEITL